MARLGRQGGARRGEARLGLARLGRQGGARRGEARLGLAWLGEAGKVTYKNEEMKVFKYHKYSSPVPAEDAGLELERIRRASGGTLKPSIVVDEARPEDSVLHPAFEWDDYIAAEGWRAYQARNLMKSIRIIRANKDGTEKLQRVYVNLQATEDEARAYHAIVDVVADPNKRAQMVDQAWRELSAWKARFKDLLDASVDTDLVAIGFYVEKKEQEVAA
jgi:hypothetical protein